MRTTFLLPLTLCASAGSAQQTAAPVQVMELHSYGYSPSPIALTADKAVTLSFVNRSKGRHDFSAPAFFRSARIISGDVTTGEVDLRGGQTKSVTLMPAAGRYKVHCSRPLHKLMGMRAEIVVR